MDSFRLLLVEILISLQFKLLPKDHPHSKVFVECINEYLTQVQIDNE